MKFKTKTNFFLAILVTLLSVSGANASGFGNNIVVLLAGTGTAYNGDEQFERFGLLPVGALCFEMDLIDAKTGRVIGSGSDCLSDILPTEDGAGLSLTATTFFHFPGGNLVSEGRVTVMPGLADSDEFTHITGARPAPSHNSVKYGDGRFKNTTGSVSLSGAVNMSNLDPATGTGSIFFDCVFIIDIQKKRHGWNKRRRSW